MNRIAILSLFTILCSITAIQGIEITNLASSDIYVAFYQMYEGRANREIRENDPNFSRETVKLRPQETKSFAVPGSKCAESFGVGSARSCTKHKKVYAFFSSQEKRLDDVIIGKDYPQDSSDLFALPPKRGEKYLIFFNKDGFNPEYATDLSKAELSTIHANKLNATPKKYEEAIQEYLKFVAWRK